MVERSETIPVSAVSVKLSEMKAIADFEEIV
jgi:hypothetical protein